MPTVPARRGHVPDRDRPSHDRTSRDTHSRDTHSRHTHTVADVMTTEVLTVRPETSFREAVRLLEEHGVDALPVVDGSGRVVGVLSESDLLLKEEAQDSRRGLPWQRRSDRRRAAATTVEGVMCRRPVTVSPDATLSAAARLMHRHRVGGLPVVERDARLLGIVTRSDLLTVFLRSDDDLHAEVVDLLGTSARVLSSTVSDGRVTLEGHVRLRSEALAVTRLVGRVPGVVDVDRRLRWDVDDVEVANLVP